MVADIRSGASPGGALHYNKEKADKGEAEVLFWQKMRYPFDGRGLVDIDACMESFRPYLQANRRTTNTVFHTSLSPSPEDTLSDARLREIVHEYMERMGYGDQPYIVFKHKDIDREHLHVVSLRVDESGRKIRDSHERSRSMEVLREIERKYGLHPAVRGYGAGEEHLLRKVNYTEGNLKRQIASVVRECLQRYACSSYGEFRTLLETFNISIEERVGCVAGREYAGIVYGALTDEGRGVGKTLKSSLLGKDTGYDALRRYYEGSRAALHRPGALEHTREVVTEALRSSASETEFRRRLAADGIDAVLRRNAADRIYGATFIDHRTGVVANGSLLGREFAANALQVRFEPTEEFPRQKEESVLQPIRPSTSLWEMFDMQAFEEQQAQKRRRKRRKRRLQ